ncbi:MAG TPA: hypothetical protein VMT17_01555 [Anaeromyxobacteraceae bacterium]|nr:hypothetical protein [Anaeromyxobacteraceae bacterium]
MFTPNGVRFTVDTDPHYHVLRVQRAIAEWPRVAPSDPWLDYPNGVEIVWPPLFDAAIAATARAAGAGHPTPELVEAVAAFFPVVLGVATVAAVPWLGSALLGGGPWLGAGLVLALLPVHARFSIVGRPDQHVAEVLIFCLVLLAFAHSFRGRHRLASVAFLGLCLSGAFWTWQGSALDLAVVGWVLAGWHVVAPAGDRAARDMAWGVALGAAVAGGLFALSLVAFGPPGALGRMTLTGLSGFPVALCAMTAAFAAGILAVRRRWPADSPVARALQLAVVAALAALPLAVPAMWPPLRQGAMAFARSGRWYSTISEFSPMFGQYPWREELPYRFAQLGFTLLVAPLAWIPIARAWRERPSDRAILFTFVAVLAPFYALALLRVRFGAYLAPLLAIAVACAVRQGSRWLARRAHLQGAMGEGALTAIGLLLVTVPTPARIQEGLSPDGLGTDETLVRTLRELGSLPPSSPDRPAVFARWPLGHLVRYYAGKPVVGNGFGIEGGERSLDDWAAFAFAGDEETAERVLEKRKIGFLVLGDPAEVVDHDLAFAPEGTPPLLARSDLGQLRPLPAFYDLAVTRIGVFNGSARPGRSEAGLGHYRLLLESLPGSVTSALKVFGWVPGCRVSFKVGQPSASLRVSVQLRTNLGRRYEWRSTADADPSGRAQMLLPYATGPNGYVDAAPYEVVLGPDHAAFLVPESCVLGRGALAFDLASAPPR